MSTAPIVPYSLDDYFQSMPIGSVDRAIGNNLYGINHRQVQPIVPINKDTYGLTFFVRPQLNMLGDNLRNVRLLYPLLSTEQNSIQRYVRCTLDPRLNVGAGGNETVTCPFVDPKQAFIPILSNNLNSVSGWPDVTAPTFTSHEGVYQEAYSQVDGITRNYTAFTIDATFRNTKGDPILYLFYIWLHYQSLVFEGMLVPYPDFIFDNRIDYMTRIYRLVLDPTKRFVRKIAATGVSFPMNVPIGQFFDYSNQQPYNDQSKDITIRFQCLGAQYLDDILIFEFNKTVQIFNPSMAPSRLNLTMVKINASLLNFFNNRGYPRINPDNYELEWYVEKDYYTKRVQAIGAVGTVDDVALGIKNAAQVPRSTTSTTSTAKANSTLAGAIENAKNPATASSNEDYVGD